MEDSIALLSPFPMSTGIEKTAVEPPFERRENFPVSSFRHLEGYLIRIRTKVMALAAEHANNRQPEGEEFRVSTEDIDEALSNLLADPNLRNELGLPS